VKIGTSFPLTWLGDVGLLREASQAIEEAGFDFASIGGHILGAAAGRYPGRPDRTYAACYRDPFVLFAHLAAITKRLRFRSSIMILPLYPTALVARESADGRSTRAGHDSRSRSGCCAGCGASRSSASAGASRRSTRSASSSCRSTRSRC